MFTVSMEEHHWNPRTRLQRTSPFTKTPSFLLPHRLGRTPQKRLNIGKMIRYAPKTMFPANWKLSISLVPGVPDGRILRMQEMLYPFSSFCSTSMCIYIFLLSLLFFGAGGRVGVVHLLFHSEWYILGHVYLAFQISIFSHILFGLSNQTLVFQGQLW